MMNKSLVQSSPSSEIPIKRPFVGVAHSGSYVFCRNPSCNSEVAAVFPRLRQCWIVGTAKC